MPLDRFCIDCFHYCWVTDDRLKMWEHNKKAWFNKLIQNSGPNNKPIHILLKHTWNINTKWPHTDLQSQVSTNFKDVYLSNLQSLGDLSLQSIRVTTKKKKNLSALKNDKEEYKFHWLWLTNRPAFGHKIIDFTLNATVEVFKCLGTHSNPHTPPRPHIPVDQVFSHLVHLQWRL